MKPTTIMLNQNCSIDIDKIENDNVWTATFHDQDINAGKPIMQAMSIDYHATLADLIQQLLNNDNEDYRKLAVNAFVAGNWQTMDTAPLDKRIDILDSGKRLTNVHWGSEMADWVTDEGEMPNSPEGWMHRPDNPASPETDPVPDDSNEMTP